MKVEGITSSNNKINEICGIISRYALSVVDKVYQNKKECVSDAVYHHANYLSLEEEEKIDEDTANRKQNQKKKAADAEGDEKLKFYFDTEDYVKEEKLVDGVKKVVKSEKKQKVKKEKQHLIVISADSKQVLTYFLERYFREIDNFYNNSKKKFPAVDETQFIEKFVKDAEMSPGGVSCITPFMKAITDKINVDEHFKTDYGDLKNLFSSKLKLQFKKLKRNGYETGIDYCINLLVKFIKVMAIQYGVQNYEKRCSTLSLMTILRILSSITNPVVIDEQTFIDCVEYIKSKKGSTVRGKKAKNDSKAELNEVAAEDVQSVNEALDEEANDTNWGESAALGEDDETGIATE
jgi:hypothetical protein